MKKDKAKVEKDNEQDQPFNEASLKPAMIMDLEVKSCAKKMKIKVLSKINVLKG